MKVRELIERLDEAIADLKIAIVANQQRIFESPHTSFEFTQRAIELQEILDEVEKLRKMFADKDPEEDIEKYLKPGEAEEILKFLDLLERSKAHFY
jgi:primosomal protein N''